MWVTFQTKSQATITMFGDVAVALFKLMGTTEPCQTPRLAEDVPAACSL